MRNPCLSIAMLDIHAIRLQLKTSRSPSHTNDYPFKD